MPQVTLPSGITLEYDRQGSGEPVLLVMGLGGQLIDWPDDLVAHLLDGGYEVIRFDNRDIGLSTMTDWTPPGRLRALLAFLFRRKLKGVGYTIDDMADDAAGLLDALDLDSAHVVGISMGGMIAQALAIRHPQTVRSMCSIMSNTGDRKHGNVSVSLMRQVGPPRRVTAKNAVAEGLRLWKPLAGDYFDEDLARGRIEASLARAFHPDGVERQTAAIAGSDDRTADLASVTAPTLVIHGLKDLLIVPSGGIATAEAIPGSRLLMFPGMGHDLPPELNGEIVDAIVANTRRAPQLQLG